jgi:hypothetical protein
MLPYLEVGLLFWASVGRPRFISRCGGLRWSILAVEAVSLAVVCVLWSVIYGQLCGQAKMGDDTRTNALIQRHLAANPLHYCPNRPLSPPSSLQKFAWLVGIFVSAEMTVIGG